MDPGQRNLEVSIGERQQTPMLSILFPARNYLKKSPAQDRIDASCAVIPPSHGQKKGDAFMCGAEHLLWYLWAPGMGCGV